VVGGSPSLPSIVVFVPVSVWTAIPPLLPLSLVLVSVAAGFTFACYSVAVLPPVEAQPIRVAITVSVNIAGKFCFSLKLILFFLYFF